MKIPLYLTFFLLTSLWVSAQEFSSGSSSSDSGSNYLSSSSSSNLGIIVGENYILKPSDVIQVSVYQEPDLDKSVRIEADGTVTLALVNKIKVSDLTVSEAQDLITQLYNRDYLVDPQISVLVTSFSPKLVRILGSVNRPGVIDMPPDREMTLTEAIANANGVSRLGNPKSITIKRVGADGETQQFEVNFNRILMNANAKDIVLEEGDTIWIPERII
jgi:polysaccharide export outer membrane protein